MATYSEGVWFWPGFRMGGPLAELWSNSDVAFLHFRLKQHRYRRPPLDFRHSTRAACPLRRVVVGSIPRTRRKVHRCSSPSSSFRHVAVDRLRQKPHLVQSFFAHVRRGPERPAPVLSDQVYPGIERTRPVCLAEPRNSAAVGSPVRQIAQSAPVSTRQRSEDAGVHSNSSPRGRQSRQ